MRDITKLHPEVQTLAYKLVEQCASQGVKIKITDCVRTKAEQDALYAQGRTTSGDTVTNARYPQSNHNWGIAFDFCLEMDIDGDGKVSDDAFNNSTAMFDKVGRIAISLGLIWGGNFKSFKDRPHLEYVKFGDWQDLLTEFKTPEAFFATFNNTKAPVAPTPTLAHHVGEHVIFSTCYKSSTDPISLHIPATKLSRNHGLITKIVPGAPNPYLLDDGLCWVNDGDIRGPYVMNSEFPYNGVCTGDHVNIRTGAGKENPSLCQINTGQKVSVLSKKEDWFKIVASGTVGYTHSKYISKV